MITVEVARDELIGIYRSDPTFQNHVNPDGKSYIEELVRTPWFVGREQYALLELFMLDFGMTRGTQNQRFLSRCAMWIGEGPHLELLGLLLSLGFDATMIDSPQAQEWPEPCSPNWWAEDIAPDPFFVEYQSMLLRDNQGFAKMTPLHEAVLFGSLESVSHWISRSDKDERNFLGQTPIHLAISNPKHLPALVQSGHDLDAADNYGITPLMYAAATNQEQCLMELLNAGANTSLLDTRYQRNFLQYAALRGHWSLVLKTLCLVEATAEKEVAEGWARFATILFQVVYPDYFAERSVSFCQLLAKCGSANFTFGDGKTGVQNNSLLHYVTSVKDVEVLLDHGFTLINHVNSAGQHALMTAALNLSRPDVIRRLLDTGADVDLRDNLQHTTLFYVLNKLQKARIDNAYGIMDIVRSLLANNTDILSRDDCKCPCSPGGCLSSALLEHSVWVNFLSASAPVWSLEWLSLISEHLGESEAKIVLLSFIRRAKFNELGMTHVCCGRDTDYSILRLFQNHPIPDDDVVEILEEKDEFVEILEYEMAQRSNQNYETLLDDWMLQMEASLEKLCETAIEYNKELARNKCLREVVKPRVSPF
ncbi:ankyrin repeat-containing domain protein [Halenospora varia]|nr:ankyrin repeat-containing domain protein [Halenospora varia]